MIYIASKRSKIENIAKRHPGAVILDVSSKGEGRLKAFSPFYPHGDIPVPFSPGVTAASVEGIWQALKVFEGADVDLSQLENRSMRQIKRTVRRFGPPLGHRKGIAGKELLGYMEARYEIYLPSYRWVLEHKVADMLRRLHELAAHEDVVLLDYNTNEDIDDPRKPLSHAALIKAYVEGKAPFADVQWTTEPTTAKPAETKGLSQPSLFDLSALKQDND